MRFALLRKAGPNTEAGMPPTQELIDAMMAYMAELTEAGVLISGDGLKPSAQGARVQIGGPQPTVTDGPFTEAKELIAGFTLIQVPSLQDAIAWVKRWPPLDGPVEIEIRPLYEMSDFGL